MAIGIAVVIAAIALIKADLDAESNDTASDYAEVRVVLNEYYKLVGRKYTSSNDYNAKEVNMALQNTSFDDGTEASTNRKGGVAGELFENDILLTLPQARRLLKEARRRNLRQAQVGKRYIWPQLNVSYVFGTLDHVNAKNAFEEMLSAIWQNQIREALNYVENEACIRFQENNNSPDYLQFIRGSGCWSNIGHIGGRQQISIGYGCEAVGIIAHETLHALGLWHEQSRSDRDQYIAINYKNVFPGTHGNFEKRSSLTTDNMGQPYDLGSVMHYGSTAFAFDYSRNTITTLDPNFQQTIGQRTAISFKDAKMINLRYCSEVCPHQLSCRNEGYTDPNKCSRCKCPGGYGGRLCETVEESVPSTCGGEINATGSYATITNPPLQRNMRCVWRIMSSARVQVIVDHLELPCEETCLSYIELKFGAEKTSTGPRLCCSAPSTPVISDNGDFIVIFNNVGEADPRDTVFKLRYRKHNESPSTAATTTSISATTLTSITSAKMTTPRNGVPPMYGSWSKWSEWSGCSISCGGCGVRQRVRKCGPNETACQGAATVKERCGQKPCPPIVGGFVCRGRLRLPCDLIGKLQFGSSLDNVANFNRTKLPHMSLGGDNHRLIREYEKNRHARSIAASDTQFCEKRFVFSCPTALITIDLDWKRANNNLISTRGCCKGYYVSKGICEMI